VNDGVQLVLIPGAVSLAVAIVGYFGVRYTARASVKAKAEEVGLEKTKVQADAYTHARAALLDTTADLRKDVSDLRAALSAQAVEYRQQLTDQLGEHRQQLAELREERREYDALLHGRLDVLEAQRSSDGDRIRALEAQRDADRGRIESLVAYARQLIQQLREHQIVPRPAPPGLNFD
jgi:flagellar motility protein MotE (MotC chaperone)